MKKSCDNCFLALGDGGCGRWSRVSDCADWTPIPEEIQKQREQKKIDIAKAQEDCKTCIHKEVCRYPYRIGCEYKEGRKNEV